MNKTRNARQAAFFFNNCHGRQHVLLYGNRAFFDLETSGRQSRQARDLEPGQVCVVGSYGSSGEQVVFRWYAFSREASLRDDDLSMMRVFFGRSLGSETMSKQSAARSIRYRTLFKRTGDFKQGSVFRENVLVPEAVGGTKKLAERELLRPADTGAGFGDSAENSAVEAAAVRAVWKWYTDRGWSIRSVERDRCGFDLECTKGGSEERVEVKGVRGAEPCFIITAGEVKRARLDRRFVLMVVTSALSRSSRISRFPGSTFVRQFDLSPVQYRASLRC